MRFGKWLGEKMDDSFFFFLIVFFVAVCLFMVFVLLSVITYGALPAVCFVTAVFYLINQYRKDRDNDA